MKLRNILILAGSVAAASQACALSLGNSQGQVQLGAPLNLVFQVQPDDGQTAESSCITAAVWMGYPGAPGEETPGDPPAATPPPAKPAPPAPPAPPAGS